MAWTDHFANALVHKNVTYSYVIVITLESLMLASICMEKSNVRQGIFYCFSCVFSVILVVFI